MCTGTLNEIAYSQYACRARANHQRMP